MRRYDTSRGEWRDVTGTGEVARMLLAAGAPVDGEPDEQETPLITAASYGDAEVALVLISGRRRPRGAGGGRLGRRTGEARRFSTPRCSA